MTAVSVRPIPISTRSITGQHAFQAAGFESALERDFVTVCAFDPDVDTVVSQPVSVSYVGWQGRTFPYTPDYLVTYRIGASGVPVAPTRLCEVKYEAELQEKREEFKAKFAAAANYAQERGWDFEVVTDVTIRTPRLESAKFLLGFRGRDIDPDLEVRIGAYVARHEGCTVADVLDALASATPAERLVYLPAIWIMVSEFRLWTDLDRSLTNKAALFIGREFGARDDR